MLHNAELRDRGWRLSANLLSMLKAETAMARNTNATIPQRRDHDALQAERLDHTLALALELAMSTVEALHVIAEAQAVQARRDRAEMGWPLT